MDFDYCKFSQLTKESSADSRYSYGWHRAEILSALVNGVFLLALCFSIFLEAIERFFSTPGNVIGIFPGALGLNLRFYRNLFSASCGNCRVLRLSL